MLHRKWLVFKPLLGSTLLPVLGGIVGLQRHLICRTPSLQFVIYRRLGFHRCADFW